MQFLDISDNWETSYLCKRSNLSLNSSTFCPAVIHRPYSFQIILEILEIFKSKTQCHVSFPEELINKGFQSDSFVAGIMSTANDMARWMHMLLNDGNINGTQVVDPDVITATWSQANVNHHNDDDGDIQRPRSALSIFIPTLFTKMC